MDSNRRNINRKREDYIDWHDYFMATAFLAAKRSKDPCSQVGACIVNEDKKVVGVGYNGMPTGCNDDEFPWAKESKNPQDNKYYYVCHAEVNAVLNKNCADVKNCTIYVGLFPCNECAKVIIQAGIKEVIYLSDKHSHKASTMASKRMLDAANVKYWQYVPQSSKIVIDFNEIDWNDMNQLRQTPKKSNDKVDADLIEPIRDMTLNDSVTDNHSKSLDYISGSTEKFYNLCIGKVVDTVECLKCNSIVHLSTRKKLAPCQHQTSKVENDQIPSKLSTDLSADYNALKATNEQYQSIIQEIRSKTELLIENNRLLLENNQLLKEKIFALENKKN